MSNSVLLFLGTTVFRCSFTAQGHAQISLSTVSCWILLVDWSTGQTCEEVGEFNHFDWDELFDEESLKPNISYSFHVNPAELELIIDVYLEYIGYTYADDHTYGFGTTYVLDFDDFDAETDDITKPGTCQNRLSSSFFGKRFTDYWNYSLTPYQNGHIGHDPYLAYPPPNIWSLTIQNNTCSAIHYHAQLTWQQLRTCANYNQDSLHTVIQQNHDWINLTGHFYVNIVSPLQQAIDTGVYRVYQSLSAPFVIGVRKHVDLISSNGIFLFTASIIAVYKENEEGDWRLVLLTECADFLKVDHPRLLHWDADPVYGFQMLNNTGDCVNTGGSDSPDLLCLQLWEVQANHVPCPPTNFTGTYTLQFDVYCNLDPYNNTNISSIINDTCNSYFEMYDSRISLSYYLEWTDQICDADIFVIQFDGVVTFYRDSRYDVLMGADDVYGIGKDRAFVQIELTIPSNTYHIFGVDLLNVWICTTDPIYEPLKIINETYGGCLSPEVDYRWPRHIIIDREDNDLTPSGNVVLYTPFVNGIMRFSFDVDTTILRSNLHVHAQVIIDLVSESSSRRMLLQIENAPFTASQMRHFNGFVGVIDFAADTGDDSELLNRTQQSADDIIKTTAPQTTVSEVLDYVDCEDWIARIFVYVVICVVLVSLYLNGWCCWMAFWPHRKQKISRKLYCVYDVNTVSYGCVKDTGRIVIINKTQ
eukprot:235284_1